MLFCLMIVVYLYQTLHTSMLMPVLQLDAYQTAQQDSNDEHWNIITVFMYWSHSDVVCKQRYGIDMI
jgi:SPX domain protein involved in polyphosphate accumulation